MYIDNKLEILLEGAGFQWLIMAQRVVLFTCYWNCLLFIYIYNELEDGFWMHTLKFSFRSCYKYIFESAWKLLFKTFQSRGQSIVILIHNQRQYHLFDHFGELESWPALHASFPKYRLRTFIKYQDTYSYETHDQLKCVCFNCGPPKDGGCFKPHSCNNLH